MKGFCHSEKDIYGIVCDIFPFSFVRFFHPKSIFLILESSQALNFAFKEKIKAMFKRNKNDSYIAILAKHVSSGGIAGAFSLAVVYPSNYACTLLANDLRNAKKAGSERKDNDLTSVYRKNIDY